MVISNQLPTWNFQIRSLTMQNFSIPSQSKENVGTREIHLGGRLWEHLREVEKNDKDASKPVAKQLNLPNYSKQWLFAAFPYTDLGSSESPTVSTSTFRSTHLFLFSHRHIPTMQ